MIFFKNYPFISFLISVLLLPLTASYFLIITIRHFLYDCGLLKSFKPKIFTVSVGNIVAGGAGKTPVVTQIALALVKNGFKPFVVTRGYGRRSKGRIGVTYEMSADISGDEALTIFRKTGVPVICDADRSSAVKDYQDNFDAVVLDDAFQHRKIKKDLDIVLIDIGRFLGNRLLLPSGILRDSVSRLNKCDLIILTKVPDIDSASLKEKIPFLMKFNRPVYLSVMDYTGIRNNTELIKIEDIVSKKISVFCGIANPEPFFSFFSGMKIVSKHSYSDHQNYGPKFETALESMKKASDMIVTTYKDFVKLPDRTVREFNIYYLDFDHVFFDGNMKKTDIYDIISGWISAYK
jgi:tetraacyldisaccharide 4'-kinase